MKTKIINIIAFLLLLTGTSCEKFLSEKRLSSVANISSLQDMQGLLDAANRMNTASYSSLLEIATDDFFFGKSGFDRLSEFESAVFTWEDQYTFTLADESTNWTQIFHVIAVSNTILDELPDVPETRGPSKEHIEGAALFYRAFAYHHLVQIYCEAYDPHLANDLMGLPLRFNSDVHVPSKRSSLEETYRMIEEDLKRAIQLLPNDSKYKTRPTKAGGHSLLAKVYLLKEDYHNALRHADLSLSLYNTIIDYNNIDPAQTIPFSKMNEETVFYADIAVGILRPVYECYVDTSLFNSYHANDLRKDIFFKHENNGYHSFKGSYAGLVGGVFLGLSTSENLLIKSEALARLGQIDESAKALNKLLVARYDKEHFEPIIVESPEEMLRCVLEERRKELIFRGSRWADLKRLNRDPIFAKTLIRKIPGYDDVYELSPGDPKYVFLIPHNVIDISGMEQNPR